MKRGLIEREESGILSSPHEVTLIRPIVIILETYTRTQVETTAIGVLVPGVKASGSEFRGPVDRYVAAGGLETPVVPECL